MPKRWSSRAGENPVGGPRAAREQEAVPQPRTAVTRRHGILWHPHQCLTWRPRLASRLCNWLTLEVWNTSAHRRAPAIKQALPRMQASLGLRPRATICSAEESALCRACTTRTPRISAWVALVAWYWHRRGETEARLQLLAAAGRKTPQAGVQPKGLVSLPEAPYVHARTNLVLLPEDLLVAVGCRQGGGDWR